MVKNSRARCLLALAVMVAAPCASAAPWLAPGDLTLRHDIELLADAGILRGPITTWPISWPDVARDVNADLDRCGFPLCSGKIMASNPALCLTLEEWEEKFSAWVRKPEPEALLNATIFFDFRPLFCQFNLAERMRISLLRQTRGNPLFLRMLAANALAVAPPLGMIRDFVTDDDPEHPGCIDLKKFGSRLFIDAARVFALGHDVSATNTVQRLKQTGAAMNVSAEEVGAAIDAFYFIQLMRLRHQHAAQRQGREGDNLIRPDDLNEVERRILKESFRQARKLQQRLKLDYQL